MRVLLSLTLNTIILFVASGFVIMSPAYFNQL